MAKAKQLGGKGWAGVGAGAGAGISRNPGLPRTHLTKLRANTGKQTADKALGPSSVRQSVRKSYVGRTLQPSQRRAQPAGNPYRETD